MTAFSKGGKSVRTLSEFIPNATSGLSYDITSNPTEFVSGFGLGVAKNIPDTFVYPIGLGLMGAGKIANASNIPVVKDVGKQTAKKAGDFIEQYETKSQKYASDLAQGLGSGKNTDERSQRSIRAGLSMGSLTNPVGVARKLPYLKELATKTDTISKAINTGLDVAEGGAIGLGLKGIIKAQETANPLFDLGAKYTEFLNPAIQTTTSAIKKINDAIKDTTPILGTAKKTLNSIGESKAVKGIIASAINPKTLTEEFIDKAPDNPNLFLNIQKKLDSFGPRIEDVGEGLGKRNISEETINSWVSSLSKPQNERSLQEIIANAKITNNPNELNQALSFSLNNDPQKLKIAKTFIDQGNYNAVSNLSKDFDVKFGEWRKALPNTLSDIQINPEQAEALRFGLVSGSKIGKAKIDPAISKMNLSNQLNSVDKEVIETKTKADLFKKSLQNEELSYQDKIKQASELYKEKRNNFINQKPLLEEEYKINSSQVKDLEKALSKKDPEQINLLKSEFEEASSNLKTFKESLKVSPTDKANLKKEYYAKRKELAEFKKSNKEFLEEGQTTLPGTKDNINTQLTELEQELSLAQEKYQNAGKPTGESLTKLQELEQAVETSKAKLKSYERVLSPEEVTRLEEFKQKANSSKEALEKLKNEYTSFQNEYKTQLKSLGEDKKNFKRNILPQKKNEAKAYDDLVKYHEEAKKGIEKNIKAIENQSTNNLFKNVQNQILKEKTKGSTTEIVDKLNVQKLELQKQLDLIPENLRTQKFAIQDELSKTVKDLNTLQASLNKPDPTEIERLSSSIMNARTKLSEAQAQFSVNPSQELQEKILQYKQEADDAVNSLRGYKRNPTPEEATKINEYQEKIKNTKNQLLQLEETTKAQKDNVRFQLQDIESKINQTQTEVNKKSALEQWMSNGVKRDLLVEQEKLQESLSQGNDKSLKEIQEKILSISNDAKNKIKTLDISELEKLKLLGNLEEFTDRSSIVSKFTKVFMFGQLEPYVGQMMQVISAVPGARDYLIKQLGISADDFIKAQKGFYEYKAAKHNLIDAQLYQPNKRFTDAFKLESNFDTNYGIAAQANVNTDLLRKVSSKVGWNKFSKIVEKAIDILGYGAGEGYKKTSLDIAMRESFPIAKIKAQMAGIKEGSKEFDNLFIKETQNFMTLIGEKTGNLKFLYKDGDQIKVGQNLEQAINHLLGNVGGKEVKELANTLVGWPANAHRALLRSGNNAGVALDAIYKRGYSTEQDRKALLSFASDVLVNLAFFGVRGAARFPTGQTENPIETQAFAQANKYTWPMFLVNKITQSIPMTDSTRQLILEGTLGSKADNSIGGFGTSFERQKTVPIPLQVAKGAGFDVFSSKIQSMSRTASESFKDVPKEFKEGGISRGGQAVLYGLLNTIVDTFISKDIKNISTALVESKIKDPKGQDLTANFGEPSKTDVLVSAGLKNKPASFSVATTGIDKAKGIDEAVATKLDKFTVQELNTLRQEKKLKPILKQIAQENNLDVNTEEAQKLLLKAYEKTYEDKLYPKFFSTKYKKLQSNSRNLLALNPSSEELKQLKQSISENELVDLIGMAMLAGNKGFKVGKVLKRAGLITKENKQDLLSKAKEFKKRHEKEISLEAQEFFDEQDDEENEEDNEN